jgi:hypothetical protein
MIRSQCAFCGETDSTRSAIRLETAGGAPAEPSPIRSAIPNWRAGDTIPLGARTVRVIDVRDGDADALPVLVVEDAA